MKKGYRTEQLYGEGYRRASEIIAHEIFQLENTDILTTLSSSIFKGTSYGKKLEGISNEIESGAESDFLDEAYSDDATAELFAEEILEELKKATGVQINYALWLCDSVEDIISSYGLDGEALDTFDEYIVGEIVLSDTGSDGKLYGYKELPEPIRTVDRQMKEI